MDVNVYIAHHNIDEALALAERLIDNGLPRENIVSQWVFSAKSEFGTPKTNLRRSKIANECINDVALADVLVLVGDRGHEGGGGKHVELGFAMGRGKRIIVCGHQENTLLHHYSIEVATTFSELLLLLQASCKVED